MPVDDIVTAAHECAGKGYYGLLRQSWQDPTYSTGDMVRTVSECSQNQANSVGLSAGARSSSDYHTFHDAGAGFYFFREETSDLAAFARLREGQSLQPRLSSLLAAKSAGLAVGGGVLLGLPGQTVESRAVDLIWAQEAGFDYFSIAAFIPNPDTPLADTAPLPFEQILRFIAAARMTLPSTHIVLTPGILSNDEHGWESGIAAGASCVLVPETPEPYARKRGIPRSLNPGPGVFRRDS
jgi:biotin synthase